jgi:outer membrane protein
MASWGAHSKLSILLVLLLHVTTAEANQTPAFAMTLPEALRYAHEHKPELREAAARVAEAIARGQVTRARWYPTIVATAELLATTTNNTTGSYVGVPLFDNPRVSATKAETTSTASLLPNPSSLLGIGARQELFDFGQIAAQATADDLHAEAQRRSHDSTRLVIDYDIEEAFFATFAAKSVESAAEHAYERALVHRDMSKAGVDNGMRRPIELTRAEAVLDRYDLARIRARKSVTTSQVVFAASVGYPEPLLDASGSPPALEELPSLDTAFSRALERSPELASAVANLRAARQETKAVAASGRPNVYVTGAISGNAGGAGPSSGESPPGDGFAPIVPNWDVGVVLYWPLFDQTRVARERAARIAEDVAQSAADAARRKLVASVDEAYVDVESAREALPVLQRAMEAAVANYDQANARFTVGVGNAVELADAEDLRTEAEIQLALGRFELARVRAALGRLLAEAS